MEVLSHVGAKHIDLTYGRHGSSRWFSPKNCGLPAMLDIQRLVVIITLPDAHNSYGRLYVYPCIYIICIYTYPLISLTSENLHYIPIKRPIPLKIPIENPHWKSPLKTPLKTPLKIPIEKSPLKIPIENPIKFPFKAPKSHGQAWWMRARQTFRARAVNALATSQVGTGRRGPWNFDGFSWDSSGILCDLEDSMGLSIFFLFLMGF